MAKYEVKEKKGSLFPNDKKGNDKAPDLTGNFRLDGKMWNVAGWKTTSENGKPYMNLKVSEPQAKEEVKDDFDF